MATKPKRKPRTNKKADTAEDQLELPVELPAATKTVDPTKFQMPEHETDKTPSGWRRCPECKGFVKGPNTKICTNPKCNHEFAAKIKADGKSDGKGSGKRGRPPGSKNATTTNHAATELAPSRSTVADAIKAARHFIDAAGGKRAAMELMELIGQ